MTSTLEMRKATPAILAQIPSLSVVALPSEPSPSGPRASSQPL